VSLHAGSYEATNSLQQPNLIVPKTTKAQIPAGSWQHVVPALTIQVIDIPLR